jgi:hypothetical protein
VGSAFVVIRSIYYTVICWLLLHATACIWYVIPCSDYSHTTNGAIRDYCMAPSWIYSGAAMVSSPAPPGFVFYDRSVVPKPNGNIYAGIFDHGEGSSEYLMSLPKAVDYVRLNATVGQRYYYSLYWAVTTMTSVGYVRMKLLKNLATILYHTIPYYTIPYHTIPYHTIPYHTIPYHTIPYHTTP